MLQYRSYPIYINSPPEALAIARAKQIAEHAAKNNFRETARLRNVQKRLDDLTVDPAPTAIAQAFENEVVKHLDWVSTSPIGRVTLDSLNPSEKVWILPLSDEERNTDCNNCQAYVHPASREGGGGIRLHYSPAQSLIGSRWKISSDNVLFHELVHALRFGWSGSWEKAQWINGYQDQEEFIATIMENLYISSLGKTNFHSQYLQPSVLMRKEKLYDLYAQDSELITWFKRCTFSDSFIWAMARRADPPFNPWRDRPELEKRWLTVNRKRGYTRFPGS